jgi:hypothetical protein
MESGCRVPPCLLVEVRLLKRQHPLVDREEQVVLGFEVVVHRALGDAGRIDDLLDAGLGVSLRGEELHGGMGHVFGDAGVLHRTAQPIARMLAPPSITTV